MSRKKPKTTNPPITIHRGETKETYIPSKKAAFMIGRSAGWLGQMSINGHINRYRFAGESRSMYYRKDEVLAFRQKIIREGYAARIDQIPSEEIQAIDQPDRKTLEEKLTQCEKRIDMLTSRLAELFLSSADYDQTQQEYANETVRYKRIKEQLAQLNNPNNKR